MRCPYCISEIDDAALACPHCARDLYLFKPLLEKTAQLEAQVKAVAADAERRIASLEAEVAAFKQAAAIAVPAQVVEASGGYKRMLLKMLLPTFVLLVAAHGLLLFVFDVRPIVLRISTLLIPMPFGFLLGRHFAGRLWNSAGAGFVLALAAVWAMLTVTAWIDTVPVLPQDGRELREDVEYVLGIGLAFAAGVMAGEFMPALRKRGSPPHRVILLLARAVTPDEEGKLGIEKAAKQIDKLMKVSAPAAAAAASFYAGIKSLLD